MDHKDFPRWMKKLFGIGGNDAVIGQSAHSRGKQRPRGWRRAMRNARKRQRIARRNARG